MTEAKNENAETVAQCPCAGCSRLRDENRSAGKSPLAVLLSKEFGKERAIADECRKRLFGVTSFADLVNLKRSIGEPVRPIDLIAYEGKAYAFKQPTFTVPKFTMPSWDNPLRVVRKVRSIHSRKRVSPCAMRRRAKILKERTDYAKQADDLMFRVMNIMEAKIMCQPSVIKSLGAF